MLDHTCIAMTVHKCTGDPRQQSTPIYGSGVGPATPASMLHGPWSRGCPEWAKNLSKNPAQLFRHAVRRLLRTGNPGSRVYYNLSIYWRMILQHLARLPVAVAFPGLLSGFSS